MKKFVLNNDTNNFDKKYNQLKKVFLTYTALFTAGMLYINSIYAEQQAVLNEKIQQEALQEQEIERLNEELRIQEELYKQQLATQRQEEVRQANITEEAEEIEEYFDNAQEIIDQSVHIETDLNYEDLRREYCEENYGDAIAEIAPKFGISPNVIQAIATQEGAGKLENVMQVSSGWLGKKLDYYDYELNRWMQICVTSNPKENTDDCIYISTSDPNWSIYLGCAVFQKGIQYNSGHLFATYRYYNSGDSMPVVNRTANHEGMTTEEYLDDVYNAAIQHYDINDYMFLVLQFMDENPIEYSYYNPDTEEIEHYILYMTYNNRSINDVIKDEIGVIPTCSYPENNELLKAELEEYNQTLNRTL